MQKNLTRSVLNFLILILFFLNYHRVISDEEYSVKQRPNNDLIVTKSTFDKQIRYLKENFNVISINQIDKDVQQKRKVVITLMMVILTTLKTHILYLKNMNVQQ